MSKSASTHKDFYSEIPGEQQAFLRNFRKTHPPKNLEIGKVTWHYYDSETNAPVLLLLHGGFADFSMWIHQIVAFEGDFRIIAPTCPPLPVATMKTYSDGIHAILDAEKINRINLIGYSEGGLIAQVLLRNYPQKIAKVVLGHTFYPTPENKYYRYNFNLFRYLPAPLTTLIFKAFAQPDKEELQADTKWSDWYQAYFRELKSNLSKDLILTHLDLMIDFVRHCQFHPDDLSSWDGEMLITVSEDDVVFKYFSGLEKLYTQAETHIFNAGLGAHSIALISPGVFNHHIKAFLEANQVLPTKHQ